jgi:hypothetical protein
MGEMADYEIENHMDDWESPRDTTKLKDFLRNSNEELFEKTAFVRSERSKSIRNYFLTKKTLSQKQRNVLAYDILKQHYRQQNEQFD